MEKTIVGLGLGTAFGALSIHFTPLVYGYFLILAGILILLGVYIPSPNYYGSMHALSAKWRNLSIQEDVQNNKRASKAYSQCASELEDEIDG